MKNVDWLFVLFWFLIACAYGAIIVGALMNGWVLFLVLLGVLSAVALVGAGGKCWGSAHSASSLSCCSSLSWNGHFDECLDHHLRYSRRDCLGMLR